MWLYDSIHNMKFESPILYFYHPSGFFLECHFWMTLTWSEEWPDLLGEQHGLKWKSTWRIWRLVWRRYNPTWRKLNLPLKCRHGYCFPNPKKCQYGLCCGVCFYEEIVPRPSFLFPCLLTNNVIISTYLDNNLFPWDVCMGLLCDDRVLPTSIHLARFPLIIN